MLSELSLSVRDLGGGLVLECNQYPYTVQYQSFDPGAVTHRREEARSPWVAGAFPVLMTPDKPVGELIVITRGTSPEDLRVNVASLITAFRQWQYLVRVEMGAAVMSWRCDRADYKVQIHTRDWRQEPGTIVTLQFPRQPVAVSGGV